MSTAGFSSTKLRDLHLTDDLMGITCVFTREEFKLQSEVEITRLKFHEKCSERKFLDPFSAESTYKVTEKSTIKCRNFCRGFEALSRDAAFGLNGFSLAAEFYSISRRLVVSISQSRAD